MKNEPAFPVFTVDSSYDNGNTYYDFNSTEGMTMLEYYAGCALAILGDNQVSLTFEDAAEFAFNQAEAMCEEAAKRRGK